MKKYQKWLLIYLSIFAALHSVIGLWLVVSSILGKTLEYEDISILSGVYGCISWLVSTMAMVGVFAILLNVKKKLSTDVQKAVLLVINVILLPFNLVALFILFNGIWSLIRDLIS